MGAILVRPARADEAADLLEVMSTALAGEAAGGAIEHTYTDRDLETAWLRHLVSIGEGWVAEVDGGAAGFGVSVRRGAIRWLVSLFVRPESQGRGVGRSLLDRLWPPASGEDRATLVDAASRPAVGMYLQAGLTPRFPVLAFEGSVRGGSAGSAGIHLEEDGPRVADQVASADAAAFGTPRREDHAHWAAGGFGFRSLRAVDDAWLGYACWSPAGRLGPVVLAEGADWMAALDALAREVTSAGLKRLRLMVPALNRPALRWCSERGMRYQGMEILLATRRPGDWSRCLIHRAGLP